MLIQTILAASLLFSSSPSAHKMTGRSALDFKLPTLDGGAVQLGQLEGNVVLLNFWATWCAPCKKELPQFEMLQKKLRAKGVVVLAVSQDNNIDNARAFIKKHDLKLLTAWDSGKKVAKAYDVEAMPMTYVIDRKGVVRSVHKGYTKAEFKYIEAEIDALLHE